MQEVFLRAMHARVELTSEPSRMSWLYRVTTNLCLNRLRDSGRRRTLLQALPSAPEAAPGYPLDSALTVRAILRQLPVEVQEIAVYYFVDQMTQEEIAAVTGLERRTVGNRLEAFRTQALAAASSGGGAA